MTSSTDADGLTTTYNVDALGRTTDAVDPSGVDTHTVYDDVDDMVTTYEGWHSTIQNGVTAYEGVGPVEISRTDAAGNYSENATTTQDGQLLSLSRDYYDNGGQLMYSLQYTDLAGLTYSVGMDLGDAPYLETDYTYDADGNLATTTDPTGRVDSSDYDALGRQTNSYVNGTLTSSTVYDSNGNVAESIQYVASGVGLATYYTYDSNGDQTGEIDPDGVYTLTTYDNAGEAILSQTYGGASAEFDSASQSVEITDTGTLQAQTGSVYADGQLVESDVFNVTSGVASSSPSFRTTYTYDADGQSPKPWTSKPASPPTRPTTLTGTPRKPGPPTAAALTPS